MDVLCVASSANATCTANQIKGTWYFGGLVFANSGNRSVGNAITCTANFNAGGDFSNAPCTNYHSDASTPNSTHATGNLTISSACNVSGTIKIQGDPTPVAIKAGHLNGAYGSLIITQGKAAGHFTLIKQLKIARRPV